MQLTYERIDKVSKALWIEGIGMIKINQPGSNSPDSRKCRKIMLRISINHQ